MRIASWACIALLTTTAIADNPLPPFALKALPAQTAGGVTVLDINDDERPDLFLAKANGGNDLLLQQTLDGGWTKHALAPLAAHMRTETVLAADVNRDANPDLIVVRAGRTQILLNHGAGRLRDATPKSFTVPPADGAQVAFLTAADINGDGWVDLYEGRRRAGKAGAASRLWLNTAKLQNGVAQFHDAGAASGLDAGRDVVQALFLDLDNDGDQDLATLEEPGRLVLWENVDRRRFRQRPLAGLNSNGPWQVLAGADYDNDGRMDLFLTTDAATGAPPLLLQNQGGLQFSQITRGLEQAFGAAAAWLDVDNDGLLDLVVAGQATRLLRQTPQGFVATAAGLPPAAGLMVVDLDRNGFADLVLLPAPGQTAGLAAAFNGGGSHHWLSVRLRARNNASTLGARVVVYLPDGTHLLKQDLAGGGRADQDHELLFGIGRRTQIEGVRVYWPSGKFTQLEDISIDSHIGFVEPSDARGGKNVHQRLPQLQLWKKPGSPILMCK